MSGRQRDVGEYGDAVASGGSRCRSVLNGQPIQANARRAAIKYFDEIVCISSTRIAAAAVNLTNHQLRSVIICD